MDVFVRLLWKVGEFVRHNTVHFLHQVWVGGGVSWWVGLGWVVQDCRDASLCA